MDIRFCGHLTRGNPAEGICDEYRLSGVSSFDELIAVYQKIAADHPGCRLLLSLDDLPQARYTSGHARNNLGLDEATELEIAGLPAECFENGEYLGYPTTKQEFPICLRNFRERVVGVTFKDACAFGLTLDEAGQQEWLHYQNTPVALPDSPVSALVVPVEESCDALAAFPNGYFSSDLGPEHNHALARHLSGVHGYELMGVGASYLGFLRATPADQTLARAVAEDLCALYNTSPEQEPLRLAALSEAIEGRCWLWVRYTE